MDDQAFMLDMIEHLMEHELRDPALRLGFTGQLNALLASANSAYRVRGDRRGLERRVPPAVKQQVEQVVTDAGGDASAHLTEAWNEAYARTPDPVKAYAEAIKAVEAAYAPLVSPQNARQTLGTMVADVRNAPQKWESTLVDKNNSSGVTTVLTMMAQLWDGQTSRHAGTQPTRRETPHEAQAAVQLAVTLVQWATSGAFKVR
jgi:hypothetical protein